MRGERTQVEPHRRGHTKWLMIVPLSGLAVIVAGIILLEAAGPTPGPQLEPVSGLPPMAVQDDRACTRGSDETTLEELRDEHRTQEGRVSSSQVHLCPLVFDHLAVTYAGEVVGELLPRRGGAWAQVNDDVYALEVGPLVGHRELDGFNTGLSVWFPDGTHEQISDVGRPGQRGDVVLIEGTLLQSDPHDGGGLTLRATEVEVLAASVQVEDPLHHVQSVVAILLGLAAFGVVLWSRQTR